MVEDLPAFPVAGKKPTTLHQSQVFRSHRTGDFAGIRQLSDRVSPLQKHLHNPQSMWMSQRAKTLRSLSHRINASQT